MHFLAALIMLTVLLSGTAAQCTSDQCHRNVAFASGSFDDKLHQLKSEFQRMCIDLRVVKELSTSGEKRRDIEAVTQRVVTLESEVRVMDELIERLEERPP
ncbi:hypothetical protein CAPTEDRAFT_194322, partial [Capitella teleta]